MLREPLASAFRLDDEGLAWRQLRASTREIAAARRDFAASFGSCSFAEPVAELQRARSAGDDPEDATARTTLALRSFVESANDPAGDFPVQNLPLGVFRRGGEGRARVGLAIGDRVLDLPACGERGPAARPAVRGRGGLLRERA